MEKNLVGYAGVRVAIDPGWKVLDIGSGHSPNPRADVLLDKNLNEDRERGGQKLNLPAGKIFVEGDALDMPFKDKEFDYIIASHIAEHVDDPEKFCSELSRVGRAGYIETPGKLAELLFDETYHKWYVSVKDNVLIFEPKKKRRPFGVVGDAVYMLYYANKERAGRFTVRSGHPLVRGLTELFVAKPVYQLFKLLRKFTFTCHEWKGSVACKVITS